MIQIWFKQNGKSCGFGLLSIALAAMVISCTTLKERNQTILDDYNRINWSDGIDEIEAMYIVRHYMHVEDSYQGVRYYYSDKPTDTGDKWQFDTEFRNSSYERNLDQLMVIFVDKTNGKVGTRMLNENLDGVSLSRITKEFDNVDRSDGINLQEAVAISRYHYYVEAKNRYWMYKMDFNPTEGKRYWIFELSQDSGVAQLNNTSGKALKSVEGLYLVVNKSTGELTKERSFLKFIR